MRIIVLLAAVLYCNNALADERILSFSSEIHIATDGSMTVEESIEVRSEGRNIRRGIYRVFPTVYSDHYGNAYKVEFKVLSVSRDGVAETWHSERRANGVRVYIGNENTTLPPNDYHYTLLYYTNRQIGYFADHDELYWNVTGHGWTFPIDEVSATVLLPESVPANNLSISGFSGSAGSKEKNYTSAIGEGVVYITSTRPFQPRQGLTLVATWPKGVVTEPGNWQQFVYLLRDNTGLLLATATLLLSFLYLHLLWIRYGKDPAPGVIFPHYEPPAGYSPASARYITNMGYDATTLTAAVINLAVKGYVSINNHGGDYVLQRQASSKKMAAGESALLNLLFTKGSELELDNENHAAIGSARSAHKRALKRDYLNIYFKYNTAKILPSLIAALLVSALIGVLQAFTPIVIAALVITAVLHGFYIYLLRAPTPKGRLLMDKLLGFKLYLEVAEQQDLQRQHPPEQTPELFERYLPYAIALGVEQDWAEQFSEVFKELQEQPGKAYQPAWYGGNFNATQLGSFAGEVGNSFSSAISSAAAAPGSSSGSGGGGSSGGGGGGGGGGGW